MTAVPGVDVSSESRGVRRGLVLAVAVGAVLRCWNLGQRPLRFGESFTAIAGRMPLRAMLEFLRSRDSHPPLDYVLRAPIARAGASSLVLRLPSVGCSVAALALFAWWARRLGRVGVIATALMAVSTFQIAHGREARMYADLELFGVICLVVADAWLARPRRALAYAVGAVTLASLLTHVQALLLIVGLIALAGRRTDHEAWRWRAAIGGAVATWAALWGRSFAVQSSGGHSAWIARTTLSGTMSAVASLVTSTASLRLVVIAAMLSGVAIVWRTDAYRLGRLWVCGFAIPVGCAVVAGLFAPVVLDRTFTLVSWGPLLAIAAALDALVRVCRRLGIAALTAGAIALSSAAVSSVLIRTPPDAPTRYLEAVARRGDTVAFGADRVSLAWSVAVRSDDGVATPTRLVALPGVTAFRLGRGRTTGRVWLLVPRRAAASLAPRSRCRRPWIGQRYAVVCLRSSQTTVPALRQSVADGAARQPTRTANATSEPSVSPTHVRNGRSATASDGR